MLLPLTQPAAPPVPRDALRPPLGPGRVAFGTFRASCRPYGYDAGAKVHLRCLDEFRRLLMNSSDRPSS